MAEKTKIEWCDSVLNLQMGCDGCELWTGNVRTCYAGVMTERYGGKNPGFPESFDKPKLYPERLAKALRWKDLTGAERPGKPWLNGMPRLIFLDDMGDTFTESLPLDWLAVHLPAMADSPHQFLCLTKRPSRMRQFSEQHELPANFWPGTSITKQQDRRVTELLGVRGGGPKFVSAEPLLSEVNLVRVLIEHKLSLGPPRSFHRDDFVPPPWVRWCIIGGESGSSARPCNIEWIRSLIRQSDHGGFSCFVKQLGSNSTGWSYDDDFGIAMTDGNDGFAVANFSDPKGGDISEFPEDLRVRQFPEQRDD